MVGIPPTSATRHSARIEEARNKQAEEEVKKARQAWLKKYKLPQDGSLDFEERTVNVRGYNITRKILFRTFDKTDIGEWARKAFHENSNNSVFYPGQIIRATIPYPQGDLEAPYNPPQGEIAMTKAGPVGCKLRYMVILWSTSYGIFGLPMYTFHGETTFDKLQDERKKDFVTIVTEDLDYDAGQTTHAGMPIIMNINPEADNADKIDPWAYIDLSRPHPIGKYGYLEENIGSIDGDEYLRLVSLYLFRQEDWLRAAFRRFNIAYSADKLLKPIEVTKGRPKFEELPDWAQKMAELEFRRQINSKRKELRKYKPPGAAVVKKGKKK